MKLEEFKGDEHEFCQVLTEFVEYINKSEN